MLVRSTETGLIGRINWVINTPGGQVADDDWHECADNFEVSSQTKFFNTHVSWHVIWKMCGGLKLFI